MRMRALLALAVSISTPAYAQISFSSTQVAGPDNFSNRSLYNRARLFSEDNKTFYFRGYGCQWTVNRDLYVRLKTLFDRSPNGLSDSQIAPITQNPDVVRVASVTNSVAAGYQTVAPLDYIAILEKGALIDVDPRRPSFISCSKPFGLLIGRARNGSPAAIIVAGSKPSHSLLFIMSKDYFTPRSESEAWQAAGSIGLAILKAWISSKAHP